MADSASIFALRSNNSTLIHQLYDSTTIQLRYQSFVIRLKDKPRVGAPIRQNLASWTAKTENYLFVWAIYFEKGEQSGRN